MSGPRSPVQLEGDQAEVLIRAAGMAPSLHNSQPWAFAVGPRHIEVYADASRQLPSADARGRSLLVSCGAAVFNLRVALEHLGFSPRLRLLPDTEDATYLAVIEVRGRKRTRGTLGRYYDAIPARRTNRRPFKDAQVPGPVLAALGDAARAEGAALHVFDDPDEAERIIDLLGDADLVDRTDPSRIAERRLWIGDRPPGSDDGIPEESLGPRPMQPRTAFRDLGQAGVPRDHEEFERAPILAVLSTTSDRPLDWLRAGQALERLLLEATLAGISASFMNQSLEQDDLRCLVRNPLAGIGNSQMIVRLGYGDPVPATPRRPIRQVLRDPRLNP